MRFVLTLALVLFISCVSWAGQFQFRYPDVSDSQHKEWRREMQSGKVLETLAAELNGALTIPQNVLLTFDECDEANAYYTSEDRTITICYELVDELYVDFGQELKGEALDDAVENATLFFLYHELGHALVDVLDLPITGKEEDAVDQLSTFVLADGTEDGDGAALDGALSFYQEEGDDEPAYWDEHSLNQQRFFNIVCWVYGSNPAKYKGLVNDGTLPEARAERCPSEWQQLDSSWTKLLATNIKKKG